MNNLLDRIYKAAGLVSALLILAICLLVSLQIVLNAIGRLSPGLLPSTIPSYADFAGFMLASSTFLAMAYTLRSGGHVRVNLFVQRLPQGGTLLAEAAALVAGAAFVGLALWYTVALVLESFHYGDVSSGIVPVPLWVPQSVMAAGLALLLVAMLHTLADLARLRRPTLNSPDEV
ncbi:TRAP transporter small permease [Limimaricola sp.]|uniref:TRAP transporter small permease n=1 Tax=Limimaricola sp. TaxID=2211665 RepID=UPI004058A3DC